MAAPPDPRARLPRILFPTGLALLFAGAAVGATVDPWWVGAAVAGVGITDLLLALVFSRMAGSPR